MTAALPTTASGQYVSPLSEVLPHHYTALKGRGLSDATIRVAGIYSETSAVKVNELLGRKDGNKLVPCVVLPYRTADGKNGYARIRPDRPLIIGGNPAKYVSPSKVANEIYVPPGVPEILDKAGFELLLTEGEFKALGSTQEGFPCIGLVGVYGWKPKGKQELHPALERIAWRGRQVRIVFDSDIAEKEEVQQAESQLAAHLQHRGAVVRMVRLPHRPPGPDGKPTKMGLDDFLVAHGPAELRKLLDSAQEPAPLDPVLLKAEGKDIDPAIAAGAILRATTTDGVPRLRFHCGGFLLYRNGAYREVSPSEVRARTVQRLNEHYRKLTGRIVADVLDQLRAQSLIDFRTEPPCWLGEPPVFSDTKDYWPNEGILVAKNGLVCLSRFVEGEQHFLKPTPRYFTTAALDYAFSPEAPEAAAWIEFLRQLWPADEQSIDTLGEWFGYCLTADTRQQKILTLIGPRRSGKGTIARVLGGIIGKENVCGPTLASLGTNFGLWPLLGKTVAVISDARLSGRTDQAVVVERLLSISGEDALTVDRKCLEPVTCKLSTRLVILSNELPRLTDTSGALVSRMVLLRLTQSFLGREDHALTDRLLAERPGILLWAIHGWRRLCDRGHFVQPASAVEMLGELDDLASPVGAFVRDCCIVDPGFRVSVEDLFAEWKKWCEGSGRRESGTRQTFGRDLLAAVPSLRGIRPREGESRYRAYEGIGLRGGF